MSYSGIKGHKSREVRRAEKKLKELGSGVNKYLVKLNLDKGWTLISNSNRLRMGKYSVFP